MARALWAFLPLVAVSALLGSPTRAGAGSEGSGLDDRLWLTDSIPDNVTTFPPQEGDPGALIELPMMIGYGDNPWAFPPPVAWKMEVGDTASAEVYLSGLERVTPVPNPVYDPTAIGLIRVRGEIWQLDGDRTPVASGSVDIDSRYQGSQEVVRVAFEMTAHRAKTFDNFTAMFVLNVTGQPEPGYRVGVLLGSVDHPSHIRLPQFPVAALRAWEEAERLEEECLARRLQQMPCETPTDDPSPQTQGSPALGPVAILTIVVLASRLRHRRSSAPPRP